MDEFIEKDNYFTYMGLELIDRKELDELQNTVSIICYHVDSSGKFPFIQFLLYNNYDLFFGNTLTLPSLNLNLDDNNVDSDVETFVREKIWQYLSLANCQINDINDIKINGTYNNKYIFVDVSKIDISGLFLNSNSQVWFALTNEIVNNCKVCNIPVDKQLYLLFLNEHRLFSIINNMTCQLYSNPDVAYSGSFYKETEFQSIFGVNQIDKGFGKNYFFSLSFNDTFKHAGWSLLEKPEYRFSKLITDNDYGRYISGGINRVAILTEKNEFIVKSNDVQNIDFQINDSVCMIIDNVSYIIIKDYEQQKSLSFHKVDKRKLGQQWNPSICYSIE